MSLECGECERDLRGPHDPSCSHYKPPARCGICSEKLAEDDFGLYCPTHGASSAEADPYAALPQHLHGDGDAPQAPPTCATPGCTNPPVIRLDDRRLCRGCYTADWLKGAATLRTLAAENERLRAENERLRAEDEASAHDIARLKDSETHWLNEADRLRAERDAAWQAGAEAMRERAAYKVAKSGAIVDHPSVFMGGPSRNAIRIAGAFAAAIRALPLPDQPKEGTQ